MSITPIAVTLGDVIDAGLTLTEYSAWHDETKEERWCWHASELAGCPRKAILKRAGYARDKMDRNQRNLLAQAKLLHQWLEFCSTAYCADPSNEAEIVVAEVGYRHPDLNLAAKPDLFLRKRGRPVLVDYKTEKEGSMKRRKEQARSLHLDTSARPEHRLQLAATAMVLEANGVVAELIEEGRIWYLSRQEWFCDEQPVDLGDPHLRGEVTERVAALDAAWDAYDGGRRVIPHRLPDGSWQCTPRKEDARLGRWCEFHGPCFHPRMPA